MQIEEIEDEDPDEGLEALDDFIEEDEEEEVEDEDLLEEVESVEEPAEEINEDLDAEDSDDEEELTTDSIKELANVLRPVVAAIPDVNKRKQVSDSLATVFKKHAKKAKDSQTKKSNYSKMLGRANDSAFNNEQADLGMKIAMANNPHYKKEEK